MNARVYVSRDASALSVGAESVARAITSAAKERGLEIEIVRTGSRGLLWLEPLVEVATPTGRHAYGPITKADVAGLFAADFLNASAPPRYLGPTEEIPLLRNQQRLTFARVGVVDPTSVSDYVANGGYAGLRNALAMTPAEIVAAVTESGLRG